MGFFTEINGCSSVSSCTHTLVRGGTERIYIPKLREYFNPQIPPLSRLMNLLRVNVPGMFKF